MVKSTVVVLAMAVLVEVRGLYRLFMAVVLMSRAFLLLEISLGLPIYLILQKDLPLLVIQK